MIGPLLTVEDLHVVFHTPLGDVSVLRGVDFQVQRGQTFGLVGESGCGKTVTGRAVMGLVPPPGEIVAGRVTLDGEDLRVTNERRMRQIRGGRIAMIFQDPGAALNPVFTVGHQLKEVVQRHHAIGGKQLRHQIVQMVADVGLSNPEEMLHAYPHQLSGGMQQRVMIAMALSSDPDLLIADEPTTALDVTIQAQIIELLTELLEGRDTAVFLITHNMGVVAETCDRVAVLYAGRIVEQGGAREIFCQPRHPYTTGLLAALPHSASRGQRLRVIPGSVPDGLAPIPGCAFAARCEGVMDVCRQIQPSMRNVGADQDVACHLYSGEEQGV